MSDGDEGDERPADETIEVEFSGATEARPSDTMRRLQERDESPRYEIVGEFARGGMGAILRVWDRELRRTLAMKVVLPRGGGAQDSSPTVDEMTLGRFVEEAQVTGQLDHPGIVPVHELGIDADGQVFFTMRLVQGDDLKAVFEQLSAGAGDWTQTRVLGVISKVCEAMAFAHSKGVVHRDLKPANIMVGRFGEAYVMDWGLARVAGQEDGKDIRVRAPETPSISRVHTDRRDDSSVDSPLLTMDGDIVGTPAFMPPEQARGDVAAMGPASDVYSLGAILYQLLAGHMPYVEPGVRVGAHDIWAMTMEGPPAPLARRAPDASEELVAICDKAMQREPAERYADMGAMAEDLRAYMEGRVVQAHRTGAVIELKKWVARNKGLALASAAALVLTLSGLSLASYVQATSNAKLAEQNALLKTARKAADDEAARATAARNDALVTQSLFLADLATQRLDVGDAGTALSLALEALPADLDAPSRPRVNEAEQALYGALLSFRETASFPRDVYADDDLMSRKLHRWDTIGEFSPDGAHLLTCSSGTARIWNLAGEEVAHLQGHEVAIRHVRFSADGHRIVTTSPDTTRIWDARGRLLQVVDGLGSGARPVALSSATVIDAESTRVVVAGYVTRAWDLRGEELARIPSSEMVLALGPHGRFVLTADQCSADEPSASLPAVPRAARLWDLDTNRSTRLEGHTGQVRQAAFSPDGSRFVTVCEVTDEVDSDDENAWERPLSVRIWDIEGNELARLPEQRTGCVRCSDALESRSNGVAMTTRFSPSGDALVTICDEGAVLWSVDGSKQATFTESIDSQSRRVCFSPDGELLLTFGDFGSASRLWDRSGQKLAELRGLGTDVGPNGAFGPGGRFILTVSGTGAWLWNTRGEEILALPAPEVGQASLAVGRFSPDGRHVLIRRGTSMRLWSVDPGEVVALDAAAPPDLTGVRSRETLVAIGSAPRFLPDGSGLLRGALKSWTREWDADGNEVALRVQESPDEDETSPDRTRSLSIDRHRVILRDDRGVAVATLLHVGGVTLAVFSPDGQRILTAASDGTVRLWDGEGEALSALKRHPEGPTHAEFSPSGGRILTRGSDGELVLWSGEGEELAVLSAKGKTAYFSADGKRIVTDDPLQLWDANGTPIRALEGHGKSIKSILFDGAWNRILTVPFSSRDDPRLWDGGGELVRVLEGHGGRVRHAEISPDGEYVLTASNDGVARVWDRDGRLLQELVGHGSPVRLGTFGPDSRLILTASRDDRFECARLWSIDGSPIALLRGHETHLMEIAFSADGRRILTRGQKSVQLWNRSGAEIACLRSSGDVTAAAFVGDTARLRIVTREVSDQEYDFDGRLVGDRRPENRPVATAPDPRAGEAAREPIASPTGERIIKTSQDGVSTLVDLEGRQIARLTLNEALPRTPSFSPDGRSILVLEPVARSVEEARSIGYGSSVRVWDANGNELAAFGSGLSTAEFSPDSSRIVTGGGGVVQVWTVQGAELASLAGDGFELSPAGDRILTSRAGVARLWNWDGLEVARLDGRPLAKRWEEWSEHEQQVSATFNADGTRILTVVVGSESGMLPTLHARLFPCYAPQSLIDRARAIAPRPLTSSQRKQFHLYDRVSREVDELLGPLFEEHILVDAVLGALEAADLTDECRDRARQEARARGNPSAEALNQMAWSVVDPARSMGGDVAGALRHARAAVSLAPSNAAYVDTLAWAHFANGHFDEALAESARALELAGQVASYQEYLERLRAKIEEARGR